MVEIKYDEFNNCLCYDNDDNFLKWRLLFPPKLHSNKLYNRNYINLNASLPASSPIVERRKSRNHRNNNRYKTQPITFDEIIEADEECVADINNNILNNNINNNINNNNISNNNINNNKINKNNINNNIHNRFNSNILNNHSTTNNNINNNIISNHLTTNNDTNNNIQTTSTSATYINSRDIISTQNDSNNSINNQIKLSDVGTVIRSGGDEAGNGSSQDIIRLGQDKMCSVQDGMRSDEASGSMSGAEMEEAWRRRRSLRFMKNSVKEEEEEEMD